MSSFKNHLGYRVEGGNRNFGGGGGETILSVELIKEWRIIFTANLLHQTESQRRSRTFMPSGNLSRTSLLSYRPNTGASLY